MSSLPPRRIADRLLRRLAVAAFAVAVAANGAWAVWRSGSWIGSGVAVAPEGAATARVRAFGEPWVEAVARLRQVIPADGSYTLVNSGSEGDGNAYWVRFELAPRRPHYLGPWAELAATGEVRLPDPWVVVAFPQPQPPVLLERAQFRELLEGRHAAP